MREISVREAMTLMPEAEERAKKAKLAYELPTKSSKYSVMKVSIPRIGGDPRHVFIRPENVAFFLAANFESWSFVGNQFAVDRSDAKETELALSPHSFRDHRRLMQLGGHQEFAGARLAQEFTDDMQVEFRLRAQSTLRICIRKSTTALQLAGISDGRGGMVRTIASLFISGLTEETRQRERLVSVIEDVTNAALFELAVVNEINVEAMDFPRLEVVTAKRFETGEPPTVPQLRYSPEASSLFRYAQSADRQPLLRFLAFYQVMEHFFPTYTDQENLARIRQIIIDPTFSSDDRTKLARLAQVIRTRSFPSEKDQLRLTIQHCVDADDLHDFISREPDRAKFVGLKTEGIRHVSRIALKDQNSPIHTQVANRIYELRCRIVHAKDGGGPSESELLLPFGPEARLLDHDIDIARFVAQRVLIASAHTTSWS